MPSIAYFDTFSGISGDMVLGALLDAGLRLEDLTRGLAGLKLGGFLITAEKVHRGPFHATRARVIIEARVNINSEKEARHFPPAGEGHSHTHTHSHEHGQGHVHDHGHDHGKGGGGQERTLSEILRLIRDGDLPARVKEDASRVFERIGAAEAKIHGIPIESVHFHEVGAVDSIVDIVGSCLALRLLGVEEVWFSHATVGTGFVRGAHGEIPLPAPATLEILRGIPLRQRETGFELTTPTGAGLTAALGRGFGPMPDLAVASVGYGAGDDRPGPVPNLLRVVLGERSGRPAESDRVISLETSLDDTSPQVLGHLMDLLLEAGALDVAISPIQMKKNRPGHEVRVLATPGADGRLAEIIFRETNTLGIRRSELERLVLERGHETVTTPWGPVRIKIGRREGKVLTAAPEYEEARRLALEAGVPLKEVHRAALEAYHRRERAE